MFTYDNTSCVACTHNGPHLPRTGVRMLSLCGRPKAETPFHISHETAHMSAKRGYVLIAMFFLVSIMCAINVSYTHLPAFLSHQSARGTPNSQLLRWVYVYTAVVGWMVVILAMCLYDMVRGMRWGEVKMVKVVKVD